MDLHDTARDDATSPRNDVRTHPDGTVPITDVRDLVPIDRNEMVGLATTEYARLLTLLHDLDAPDWQRPTVCDGWSVHDMVAHLLGAADANASIRETIRQTVRGRRRVRGTDRPLIDGINDVQVEARRRLEPAALCQRLAVAGAKGVRGRRRTPAPLRRVPVPGPIGPIRLGHLMDVVYTRDQWMHRVDISLATGRDLELTADHDARIVADVVREWAATHSSPVTLELTGPAGGRFQQHGGGDQTLRLDAVAFCLAVSGREPGDGLLGVEVVF